MTAAKKPRASGDRISTKDFVPPDVTGLSKREARHPIRVDGGTVGKSASAHATASGKAMLAWLPEHEIRRIVSVHGMTRFTPHTITEFPDLIDHLRHVRRNGYALDSALVIDGGKSLSVAGTEYIAQTLVQTGGTIGTLLVGTSTIAGSITSSGQVNVTGDLTNGTITGALAGTLVVSGNIGTLAVTGSVSGTVQSASVGTMTVGANVAVVSPSPILIARCT